MRENYPYGSEGGEDESPCPPPIVEQEAEGQMILGGATSHILAHSELPVLIAH